MGWGEGANNIKHQNLLQKILYTGDGAGEGRYSDVGLLCSLQLLLPPCPSSASWLRSSTGSGRPCFLPSTSSAPVTKWSSFISASTSRSGVTRPWQTVSCHQLGSCRSGDNLIPGRADHVTCTVSCCLSALPFAPHFGWCR